MTWLQFYYMELGKSKQKYEMSYTPVFQQIVAEIQHFNEEPDTKEFHSIT